MNYFILRETMLLIASSDNITKDTSACEETKFKILPRCNNSRQRHKSYNFIVFYSANLLTVTN